LLIAIDGKGDPDPAEEKLGLAAPEAHQIGGRVVEPVLEATIGVAGVASHPVHFIESGHGSPLTRQLGAKAVPANWRVAR